MPRRYSWVEIAKYMSSNGFGYSTEHESIQDASREQAGTSSTNMAMLAQDTVVLLSGIASQQRELLAAIHALTMEVRRLPAALSSSRLAARSKLEKERQKTADKQRKANEALPPSVRVIQMPDDAIARLGKRIKDRY